MVKLNKKLIIPGILVTAFMVAALYGSGQIFAEEVSQYPPIVKNIAGRFNLNESDVNEVFEQERADMWQKRKKIFSDKLDAAVKDGKITESQKQKILDKEDEMKANREAERKQNKDDMQNWMKDNGIDPNVLTAYFGFEGFGNKNHFNHMRLQN